MTRLLVDTNILLDLANSDPKWHAWSSNQLDAADEVFINPIIFAELAIAFASEEDLNEWLLRRLFIRLELPYSAAFIAAKAFLRYRQLGGTRTTPMSDFYIGAHAQVADLTLLTRDPSR